MYKDYFKQESTENNTFKIIQKDNTIQTYLQNNNIPVSLICDYHMYPIADNDAPYLSSDRLEYTLSNAINYHCASQQTIQKIYADIRVGCNENGQKELVFLHSQHAERFAQLALLCGKVYVSKEDRFAMEALARLVKLCIQEGILMEQDLWKDEAFVIQKICCSKYKDVWEQYCNLVAVHQEQDGICIPSKKRYIDPYVIGKGRICSIRDTIKREVDAFLQEDLQEKLIGVCKDGRKYNCSSKW